MSYEKGKLRTWSKPSQLSSSIYRFPKQDMSQLMLKKKNAHWLIIDNTQRNLSYVIFHVSS